MKNMSVCQEGRKSFLVSVVGELFRKGIAAALAACAIPAANAVEMSVVNVGGVPRFAIDGKPVAATAVMPSPACKLGAAVPVLKAPPMPTSAASPTKSNPSNAPQQ